ncbi:sensor histidine kinase [Thermanaerothrix daxensis]|uniref:sensor histidine kinase n=1 Tax=Thermanaerothrix daxensis TaxID=869279 RepID=UPI0006C90D73|nr:sensor histidine kinase [Thermanaerothrix daxensis]
MKKSTTLLSASSFQALFWLVLPITLVLVLVVIGSLALHEQAMRQRLPEETWEAATDPALELTLVAPLLLLVPLAVAGAAFWFGTKQIIRPLQALEKQATALAWGDFESIRQPVGGIVEIQNLQQGLAEMARKVQASQEGLRDYINAITTAQEEERRRLARELHDDTIQSLIALKHRVQFALDSVRDPRSRRVLQELGELAENTIENLRRLTRALRPIYLEDLGLVTALEMLSREIEHASGIRVGFQCIGTEKRLDPRIELSLYRIAQEALNNVLRHSRAQEALLTIEFGDQICLEIRDNGVGFQLPASLTDFATRGHFGLLGMRERAELIGARLEVFSAPGEGTRVRVRI